MKVELEKNGNKGRYYIKDKDALMGEVTYTMAGSALMIIDHTHVEQAYRGHGIGAKIVQHIVQEVRENQMKILPLCPFASAAIAKDKTLQDVLS